MIKIDTDFNLNVLLKLFFSLSKKIIFFSPILTNNNLTLKISSLLLFFFSFLPFLLALRLLVLGGIDSVIGSGDAESIRVCDEDEAVEFGVGEWLRGKGLEIENGVRVGGFDWEGFADLIEVEVGVIDAFAFNFVL